MNVFPGIRRFGLALCALGCLGFSALAAAQDAGQSPIQITSAAFQEVQVKAPDGSIKVTLEPATRIAPGGVVVYEISFHNIGAVPATDVAIENAVAPELAFLESSIEPSEVSVDDGNHFGQLADLTVVGADGHARPALKSDITNLRWTIASLGPDARGKVSFRARVK